MILLGLVLALLLAQPDMGQTLLVVGTWGVMFFMAGLSWVWIIALGGLGIAGLFAAYEIFPHVAGRIDRFLTGEGDTFQVDMGHEALVNGGWLGLGPGEGTIKRLIPDSHADFVFAVAGEEFGLITCMVIAAIFAFIVLRGLSVSLKEHDDFTRYAIGGLVTVFGLQSVINMCVNLQLMPAKGMTLPFISYGGSSQIAIAVSMGMVLALTRRKPQKRKPLAYGFSSSILPAE
jgi:cell division protein FtsW